jgi:integrase
MARKRRGRGEGAIYQREDGLWVSSVSLGYDANGKRKRKVVYGQSKVEVQNKLRNLQATHATLHRGCPDKFTLDDHLTLWLEERVRTKTRATTYDRYKLVVEKQIAPLIGSVRLDQLTRAHVVRLYDLLEKRGESPRATQMAGIVLHTALQYALDLQYVPLNVCKGVGRPKVEQKEMKVYDASQLLEFLEAAASDRLCALYVLAVETGMRQGELFGLQWPDIDFTGGTIQVQRSLQELRGELELKPPKTSAARRRILVSAFTRDALHEHRKRMLAEGWDVKAGQVFVDEKGGFLRKSNVSRRSFRSIMKRAGLPRIRFHDLRHTAATLLLMADENVKVVSERLGHKKIEITLNTYSHVLPTMQQGAADKMNRLFMGSKDEEGRGAAGG